MKILLIQENGRHEKNRNFRECFSMKKALKKKGAECEVWGLGHENYKENISFNNFDLILNLENYDETNWVPDLSNISSKKMLWSIDSHCRGQEVYDREFKRGNYDKMLQSTKYFVNENSIWFPNCFDNTLLKNKNSEKKHSVGFCGNIVNRQPWIDLLSNQEFDFKKDIFVIGEDMVNAVNSYKIHFHKNISIDIAYRNFETMGCGTALVTSFNEDYRDLGMIDGENCMIYRDHNELIQKISLLLENEEYLLKISKAGEELANRKHTYNNRADLLLEIYENL